MRPGRAVSCDMTNIQCIGETCFRAAVVRSPALPWFLVGPEHLSAVVMTFESRLKLFRTYSAGPPPGARAGS